VPNNTKNIRDIIHGYIPIRQQDLQIIDTDIFQRLRRIKQGYVQTVYPCANHSRFEHSLGVMYLGTKVIEHLKDQLTTEFGVSEKRYYELYNTVIYACLLHDIGHAPFSHIGEKFYDKNEITTILSCQLKENGIIAELHGEAAEHELCSCAIALEYFGEMLKDQIDLELFCRMITGEAYNKKDKRVEDVIISILNSDFDVDKLDYCLRDSFMTGAKIVVLDVDRLISSFIIKDDKSEGRPVLAFSSKSLSTISNFVYGREAVYMWIVSHHITIFTDCIFIRLINHLMEITQKQNEYFGYDAICKDLKDDYDLISFIRHYKKGDAYAEHLYNQLFNRDYYKALWKNYYEYPSTEYHSYLSMVSRTKKTKYGNGLEDLIIKKYPIFSKGDFYIASTDYTKPLAPLQVKDISIVINGKVEKFEKIFAKTFTKDSKTDIPFIFVKDSKRSELLDILTSDKLADL